MINENKEIRRSLKVCLAMGGGVSLGAYSGAALTEALKLLVLYGQDNDGNQYETVELDGMSGASAGSIALVIMMRALIDYKSLDHPDVLKYFNATKENFDEKIQDKIKKQYGDGDRVRDKMPQLKSLEVAQALQKIIWVDVLDTNILFAEEKDSDGFARAFGFLSRSKAIEKVKDIIFSGFPNIAYNKDKTILSKRALMAFTMANLSPISYGEKTTVQNGVPPLVKNLQQATNINNHNELRVFDLCFEQVKVENRDNRFITVPDDRNRSISDKKTWVEMLSSAIASGAFPLGFSPVVITRYKEEYSKSEWPDGDLESLNFAYVDGGTFNNEPIKEAFKLGAFIDFQTYKPDIRKTEDRLILFVDPFVPDGNKVQQLKSLDPLKELNGNWNVTKPVTTLMIDSVMDLSRMVAGQGKINEEAKIQAFYKTSMLNESLFNYFVGLKSLDIKLLLQTTLLKSTYENIEKSLESRHISIGTRSVSNLLFSKYNKICNLKGKDDQTCLTKDTIVEIYKELDHFVSSKQVNLEYTIEQLKTIINRSGCNEETELLNLSASIFLAISEMALNQFGKDFTAERAGIFPVNKDLKIEVLPGSSLAAFGGFASKNAREACFAKGKLDSIRCLKTDDFREYHYLYMLGKNKKVQSYLPADKISEIEIKHENKYDEWVVKWGDYSKRDMRKNMRKKLQGRLSSIVNDLVGSLKRSGKGENFISRIPVIIRYLKLYYGNSLPVINKILSEAEIDHLTHYKKNIAVKFRLNEKIKNIDCQINNGNMVKMNTVTGDGNSYFKIYLVMTDHLKQNEGQFSEYCYLSINKLVEISKIKSINKLEGVDDIQKIKSVQFNETIISQSDILKAFETNYHKFKYGINPVFDIDHKGNITIDDLSKPLANEIIKDWEPFL